MRAQFFALSLLLGLLATSAVASQQSAPPAENPGPSTPKDNAITVADLFSTKKESLIGSPVTLRGVQVRSRVGSDAIWIGASPEQMLLVTMPTIVRPLFPDGRQANVNKGDIVTINGVVQRAPLPHLLQEGWGVDRVDAELIGTVGVIINGMKVEVAERQR